MSHLKVNAHYPTLYFSGNPVRDNPYQPNLCSPVLFVPLFKQVKLDLTGYLDKYRTLGIPEQAVADKSGQSNGERAEHVY